MAKTGKIKKKTSTIHSRAARRAVSPSMNLDKSLKPTPATRASPPPKSSTVLGARPSGITKSKSKSKPLKRQQRVRQLQAFERAEVVLDKLQHKVQKSVGKEKKVVERKKGWEEVNVEKRKLLDLGAKKGNAYEALEEEDGKEREWVSDEEMDPVDDVAGEKVEMAIEDTGMLPEAQGEVEEVIVPESVPLPVATLGEDELL